MGYLGGTHRIVITKQFSTLVFEVSVHHNAARSVLGWVATLVVSGVVCVCVRTPSTSTYSTHSITHSLISGTVANLTRHCLAAAAGFTPKSISPSCYENIQGFYGDCAFRTGAYTPISHMHSHGSILSHIALSHTPQISFQPDPTNAVPAT